jgi:hypothetical protein
MCGKHLHGEDRHPGVRKKRYRCFDSSGVCGMDCRKLEASTSVTPRGRHPLPVRTVASAAACLPATAALARQ